MYVNICQQMPGNKAFQINFLTLELHIAKIGPVDPQFYSGHTQRMYRHGLPGILGLPSQLWQTIIFFNFNYHCTCSHPSILAIG